MHTCSPPLPAARMMKPAARIMSRTLRHARLGCAIAQRSSTSFHAEPLGAHGEVRGALCMCCPCHMQGAWLMSRVSAAQDAGRSFRVDEGHSKTRLDAFLSAAMPDASRAKLQASIREGLITVNGMAPSKPGHSVRAGDQITCRLLPPAPMEAAPEVRVRQPQQHCCGAVPRSFHLRTGCSWTPAALACRTYPWRLCSRMSTCWSSTRRPA